MALKFKNVFSQLQMKIVFGEWPEGFKIPTEMELCEQYGVSRVTIRRALDGLVRYGYIARSRGRGSFVSFKRTVVGLGYPQSATSELEKPSHGTFKVLVLESVYATMTDKEQLGLLEPGSDVKLLHLKSLHLVNGKPTVLSDYYIAEQYGAAFRGLGEFTDLSFFELVSEYENQKCHFVKGKVAAINPDEEICKQLGTRLNSPSLWCRGLCVLDDGTIVGRCTKVFNGLMYEFAADSQVDMLISKS